MADLLSQALDIATRAGKKNLGDVSMADLMKGGMSADDAMHAVSTMAQNSINSGSVNITPPGFKFERQTTPAAQALGASAINGAIGSGMISAQQVVANGGAAGVNLANQFGNNAVAGVYTPASTGGGGGDSGGGGGGGGGGGTKAGKASAPRARNIPSARSPQDIANLAAARAALSVGYRQDAVGRNLSRRNAQFDESAMAIPAMLNQAWASNDEEAARAGFFTSGRRFALRDQSSTAATQQLSAIERARQQAMTEATDEYGNIARDQGLMETNLLGSLEDSNRDYALRSADLNSTLDSRDFQLSRGQQMLPYELQGMQLSNDTAAFGLSRGRQLLPGELASQAIGNRTAQAAYDDQYTQGGLGYQSRSIANKTAQGYYNDQYTPGGQTYQGRNIANQTAQANYNDLYTPGGLGNQSRQAAVALQNLQIQAAQLENELARDPDVGKKKQLQAQLDQTYAQIEASRAQAQAALMRASGGGGGGGLDGSGLDFSDDMKSSVDNMVKMYDVTPGAAELWWNINNVWDQANQQRAGVNQQAMQSYKGIAAPTNSQEARNLAYEIRGTRNSLPGGVSSPEVHKYIEQALGQGQIDSRDAAFLKALADQKGGVLGAQDTVTASRLRQPKPTNGIDFGNFYALPK